MELVKEENYHYKLEHFKPQIEKYLKENQFLVPLHYKENVLKELTEITDLSISRPAKRMLWGIKVPKNLDDNIYVWLDALCNYLTILGKYFNFNFFLFETKIRLRTEPTKRRRLFF